MQRGDLLDNFKRKITRHAIDEKWRFDQLQYAEDYIKELYEYGGDVKITDGLDDEYAQLIKERFLLEEGQPS